MSTVRRTAEQIEDRARLADVAATAWASRDDRPAMHYAEGVEDALRWVLGEMPEEFLLVLSGGVRP